ncbi:MAG: hypothetical protein E6F99_10530 [Actinobacteria bacterium]|nr:MAG: hypothetical protein E6F99_10530 [Actinomycetota bacterium]
MRVVGDTGPAVEVALRAGALPCPRCGGALRPWGRARLRVVRLGATARRAVRPRRARCAACRGTHVLLPGWMLGRRAHAAAVIRAVLAARARGIGYRRTALRMRLPEATVRDWLRAFRRPDPRLRQQLVAAAAAVRNTSPPPDAGAPRSVRPP